MSSPNPFSSSSSEDQSCQRKRKAGALLFIADVNSAVHIDFDEIITGEKLGNGSQGTVEKAYHPVYGTVAYKQLNNLPIAAFEQLSVSKPESQTARVLPQEGSPVVASSRGKMPAKPPTKPEKAPKEPSLNLAAANNQKRELLYTCQLDNHPNILKFLGYVWKKVAGRYVCSGMLLEYMEQGLVNDIVWYSRTQPGLRTLEHVKGWSLQKARALHFCHDKHGVVHRDIKMENALVCDNYKTLKLCDFGYARAVPKDKPMTNKPKTVCCAAPETILGKGDYGFPADVYSYGMFLYSITHKCYPFMVVDQTNEYKSITVPWKRKGSGLEQVPPEEGTTLLSNQNFLRTFLENYKDGTEDDFRPTIAFEAMKASFVEPPVEAKGHPAGCPCQFCDLPYYEEQNVRHLELLIWLMKQCWWTDAELRPTMAAIVKLLDFHFAPPLTMVMDEQRRVSLKNNGFYAVVYKLLRHDGYSFGQAVPFFQNAVTQGMLKPGESVELLSNPTTNVNRFLVEYARTEDATALEETMPTTLERTNPGTDPRSWIEKGHRYWKRGLVTFVLKI